VPKRQRPPTISVYVDVPPDDEPPPADFQAIFRRLLTSPEPDAPLPAVSTSTDAEEGGDRRAQ
jgi:hypothetical protein